METIYMLNQELLNVKGMMFKNVVKTNMYLFHSSFSGTSLKQLITQ